MVRSRLAWWAMLAGVALAGCATDGSDSAAAPTATLVSTEEKGDDSVTRTDVVTVTATVVAIDHATRMVTLRGTDGRDVSFRADDRVRNLAQVKKGDRVRADFVDAVQIRVKKPGEALPSVAAGSTSERAELGQRPGASAVESLRVTSTVTAIDRAKQTVTLRDLDGRSTTVAVRDPTNLEKVAVGDLVEVTVTEAVSLRVEDSAAE
jgi:hypothetical protein